MDRLNCERDQAIICVLVLTRKRHNVGDGEHVLEAIVPGYIIIPVSRSIQIFLPPSTEIHLNGNL
jgi:hypothetical protein